MKQISDVIIGDRILSYSPLKDKFLFSSVIAIPHERNNKINEFQHITTINNQSVKMTSFHLIPIIDCNTNNIITISPAKDIIVGQCIKTIKGKSKVITNKIVVDFGIYTVVTEEEFIVVNNIVASPFAVNHFFVNKYYDVIRYLL